MKKKEDFWRELRRPLPVPIPTPEEVVAQLYQLSPDQDAAGADAIAAWQVRAAEHGLHVTAFLIQLYGVDQLAAIWDQPNGVADDAPWLPWFLYADDVLVARVQHPEDAARLVGEGWRIEYDGVTVVWREGHEAFPAGESYDEAAAIMLRRKEGGR